MATGFPIIFSARLWTPANISTAAWFDADDATTITLNGSTVSQWKDKSGNGRNISQASAGLQPAYEQRYLNGRATLNFDQNKGLFVSGLTPFKAAWVIAIIKSPLATWRNYHTMFDIGVSSPSRIGGLMEISNTGAHFSRFPEAVWQNGTSRVVSTSCYSNITDNNIFAFQSSSAFSTISTFGIGNYDGSSLGGCAWQHETIVLGTVPSTETQQILEGYLAWKWGLQSSLANTHPYKNSPPYAR